ncbi:MAG: phage tail sheath C-terminal domain-containing protein [Bryobacteraceae bacterium]
MPIAPTYPGVYIEELSSGVRTITGVATSITAFVGYTARGLDNRAQRIFSFADYERSFGGLASNSEVSYTVQQFFDNGGSEAYVVRVPKSDGVAATITSLDAAGGAGKQALAFTALSKGAWANNLIIDVDYNGISDIKTFNLTITDQATNAVETFGPVTMDTSQSNYVVSVVNDPDNGSQMVSVAVPDPTAGRPVQTGVVGGDITLTDIKNDKEYSLKFTFDTPAGIAAVQVTFIGASDSVPGSIAGVCRLLERKANAVLSQTVLGAGIHCVPSASGKGIRILADNSPTLLTSSQDAKITVADGSPNSALTMLKLSAPGVNVGHYRMGTGRTLLAQSGAVAGADGSQLPQTADLIGDPAKFTGIYALDKVDLFNLLSIPDATRASASDPNRLDSTVDPNSIYAAAMAYCQTRRAFLLIDAPPNVNTPDKAVDWKSSGLTVHDSYAAAYFPRVRVPDPLNNFQLRTFAPSGVVAGLYARTDSSRGVWKAPAGVDASLVDVQSLVYKMNDSENGAINPLGLNCLRTFPVYGSVCWGGRTLVGSDQEGSQWKYVPVRRLALYIEESLFRGTQWVVFEPNDEPLWAQIRLNLTAFMQGLFRQGAFQGATPKDAYLVKCDHDTTTQDDVNRGVVNILVGFAPLKPAEFVYIQIQQLAGQLAA